MKRFTRTTTTWTDGTTDFVLSYLSANRPEDAVEAQRRNEQDTQTTDMMAAYRFACDTGVAHVVFTSTEEVD